MKTLVVFVPDSVLDEIGKQVIFIAMHSETNALAWEARLRRAMEALDNSHSHARDEDASKLLNREVRKFVFEGTYLIHYVVEEAKGRVEVINFRHGARLPRRGEP